LNDQGVKDVLTGEAEYRLRHPGVSFSKWATTNQFFNDTAHDRAKKNNVMLINQLDIQKLLNQHPVTNADVQRFLYAGWDEAAWADGGYTVIWEWAWWAGEVSWSFIKNETLPKMQRWPHTPAYFAFVLSCVQKHILAYLEIEACEALKRDEVPAAQRAFW
jgi:hypothetical protein